MMKRRHVRDIIRPLRECKVRGGKWTYTFLILLKCTEINRDCTPSLNNSAVLSTLSLARTASTSCSSASAVYAARQLTYGFVTGVQNTAEAAQMNFIK